MFSIVKTRPDITISIGITSYFTNNPSHAHIEVIKTIFQYLKGSIDCNITQKDNRKNFFIKDYLNSDWVKDKKI